MPIDFSINKEEKVLYTVAEGTLSDEDIIDLKHRIHSNPDYSPGMRELSDVRNVDDFQVSSAGISRFVGMDEAKADLVKEHKLAIVASGDLIFGMAKMYKFKTENFQPNVEIFRTMEEAREWLGLEQHGD